MVRFCPKFCCGSHPFGWSLVQRRYPTQLHIAAWLGGWNICGIYLIISFSNDENGFRMWISANLAPWALKKSKIGCCFSNVRLGRFWCCMGICICTHSWSVRKRELSFIHNLFNTFDESPTFFCWLICLASWTSWCSSIPFTMALAAR